MHNTSDVIHVPIRVGSHRAARKYAPMVCTCQNQYCAGMYALTRLQEIQILETRPFFNAQVTGEIIVAIITATHPMSAAIVQTPVISSHYPRGFLWPP